jgi:hypothetical protein
MDANRAAAIAETDNLGEYMCSVELAAVLPLVRETFLSPPQLT